jgi:hypothetical protein
MLNKKKKALSYECVGVFNNFLKIICSLPVLIIVQIIFLGVINILRSVEKKVEEFFSIDVLWPPKFLAEILADAATPKLLLCCACS